MNRKITASASLTLGLLAAALSGMAQAETSYEYADVIESGPSISWWRFPRPRSSAGKRKWQWIIPGSELPIRR